MTKNHIAFIAGIDPLIGYKVLETELKKDFPGILVMKPPLIKKQGFLLLQFHDEESLNTFLNAKKVKVFSRELLVSPYLTGKSRQKKKEYLEKNRLYIINIPCHWTNETLKEEFSKFGAIQQAYTIQKNNSPAKGKERAFGYVITESSDLAEYLIQLGKLKIGNDIIVIKRHKENRKSSWEDVLQDSGNMTHLRS